MIIHKFIRIVSKTGIQCFCCSKRKPKFNFLCWSYFTIFLIRNLFERHSRSLRLFCNFNCWQFSMYEIILMNGIGSSLKVRPRLIFKAIGFGHNKMICSILPEINKSNFEFLKQYLNHNKKSIISFILLNIYENIITFLLLYIVMSSINIASPHII